MDDDKSKREPDNDDAGVGREVGQGYAEEQPAGSDTGAAEPGPGAPGDGGSGAHDPAPGVSSDKDGDAGQATGNRRSAG